MINSSTVNDLTATHGRFWCLCSHYLEEKFANRANTLKLGANCTLNLFFLYSCFFNTICIIPVLKMFSKVEMLEQKTIRLGIFFSIY